MWHARYASYVATVNTKLVICSKRRKAKLPSKPPFALTSEFFEGESKQRQWVAFNGKNRLYIVVVA
jgi:hypothetical protein